MEPAILWFLQKYESTSDCDPTIIENTPVSKKKQW